MNRNYGCKNNQQDTRDGREITGIEDTTEDPLVYAQEWYCWALRKVDFQFSDKPTY